MVTTVYRPQAAPLIFTLTIVQIYVGPESAVTEDVIDLTQDSDCELVNHSQTNSTSLPVSDDSPTDSDESSK